MTLAEHLHKLYQKGIRNAADRGEAVAEFKKCLEADSVLKAEAQKRLAELEALVAARGEVACAYSNWYRIYLKEALA